jgi:hypothetical protein
LSRGGAAHHERWASIHMRLLTVFFLLITGTAMAKDPDASQQTWKTAKVMYEGYPLMLRVPDSLNYDDLKKRFPKLLVVTHALAKVMPSGLPEPDYNDSLFELDEYLVNYFVAKKQGQIVLIETFGGKRNYYFYVSSTTNKTEVVSNILKRYSKQKISASEKNDSEWSFIKGYAKEFKF